MGLAAKLALSGNHYDIETRSHAVPVERVIEHGSDPDEPVDLWPMFQRAWDYKWLILSITTIFPVAAYLAAMTVPRQYEAVATVVVATPIVRNQLQGSPIRMDAHRRVAESAHLRNLVGGRLLRDSFQEADDLGTWRAVLYSSGDSQPAYRTPMGLSVVTADPVRAQIIANAWASTFVDEQSRMATLGHEFADFILSEHATAKTALLEAERRLEEIKDKHARANERAAATYDPDLTVARLSATRGQVVSIEDDLVRVGASLADSRQRIEQLEREVKSAAPGAVLTSLSEELARVRIQYNGLRGREQAQLEQLKKNQSEAESLQRQAASHRLRRERVASAQLLELSPYELAVQEAKAHYQRLGLSVPDARMVKEGPAATLSLGAAALVPSRAIEGSHWRNVALAFPIGVITSLMAVWVLVQLKERPMTRTDNV